ncbi:hypothetical protein SEPCBS119000_004019 [Sporothrix epigloea]|uniref:DUF7907 domain-containing protein n=1 Tax=Sporothrix epigloea TaxID=1892477 RepID=A0ABP0DTI9_9PEZI
MARSTKVIALYAATVTALFWTIFGYPTPLSAFKPKTTLVASNKEKPFLLRTQVKNGGDSRFDSLYVFAYHTGAGLNDAMLRAESQKATPATAFVGSGGSGGSGGGLGSQYFAVLMQIGGSPYELMPVRGYTPYDGLQPVRINVSGAPPCVENAFYLDRDKLRWTSSADSSPPGGFDSWLACDSDHTDVGNPTSKGIQLFYRVDGGVAPTGCADVDLVAVF